MGICQAERTDINYTITKAPGHKNNPSMKLNKRKVKNNSIYSSINSPTLNSTAINNVLFNNTKRLSNSQNKYKNNIPKQKKIVKNKIQAINNNNNYSLGINDKLLTKTNNIPSNIHSRGLKKIPIPNSTRLRYKGVPTNTAKLNFKKTHL